MKRLAIILLLLIPVTGSADLESGINAYHQGDYLGAAKEFALAAESDDPKGLHHLASIYYQGHGVEKDVDRAVRLFTKAAALGYQGSQTNLALMYQRGEGVEQDMGKAIDYYLAAGKQGDLLSIFNLGQIYRKGEGVEVDLAKALACYRFAAERGYVAATHEYGLLFAQGQEVDLSYVEAFGWISFAAQAGDQLAVTNLERLRLLLGEDVVFAEMRAQEIAEQLEVGKSEDEKAE